MRVEIMGPGPARPSAGVLPSSRLAAALGIAALLAAAPRADAQTDTATLRGTVTDATGAVLPGATVTLTQARTGAVRTALTGGEGGYVIAGLAPGAYTIAVQLQGLRPYQASLTLNPRDSRGHDVTLQPGGLEEAVIVTAERELLQTETGAREGLLGSRQIEELSVIGRGSLELMRILPGVVAPDPTQLESVSILGGSSASSGYTVNGVRGTNIGVSLDGTRLADVGANNGTLIVPNNDMVEVVKVQSSNYAAEYGSAAINVSAVTKSGGNRFHGTVYAYDRDFRLAANDRSHAIAGVAKPESTFFYPGANLGGPILRDKLFFFAGVEIQRQQVDTGSVFGVVPTLKQRQGDFSEFLSGRGDNLNQPRTVNIPGTSTPAPGNDLRPYLDPLGLALINLYPRPNYDDPNNRFNYVFGKLRPTNRGEAVLRLDYAISDSAKAYLRLAYNKERAEQPRGLWWDASDYELPSPVIADNVGKSISLGIVNILSPSMTNELLITGGRLELANDFQDGSRVALGTTGLSGLTGLYPGQSGFFPSLTAFGNQGIGNLWNAMGNPLFANNDTILIADTFTKIAGSHALKFGLGLEQLRKQQNFQNDDSGRLVFNPSARPGTTGSVLGDTITGLPAEVVWGTRFPVIRFKAYNVEGYFQDAWKLRPSLTLEYGVRLAFLPNNVEQQGLGAVFDPRAYQPGQGAFVDGDVRRLNGLRYAAAGDVPKRLVDNRGLFVMPRLNFAWDLGGAGKTVVRGGAGLFVNRPQGNADYDTLRFPPNAYASSFRANTYPDLRLNNLGRFDPYRELGGQSVTSINPDSIDYPATVTASASLARRLPWDQVVEVGYVGSFGRHLYDRRQVNAIPDGTLGRGRVGNADLSNPLHRAALNGGVVNSFRPFPALGSVEYREFNATTNYHALQATLSRQSGKRLQYLLAYTLSRNRGTRAYDEQQVLVDPFDVKGRSYGLVPTDRTHVATLSYNWTAPPLAGEGASGLLKALANGWQVSGISTFTSGAPLYLAFGGDIAGGDMAIAWAGTDAHNQQNGTSAGTIAPIYRSDPARKGGDVGDHVADVRALAIPGFGESGPYVQPFGLRSPSRHFHDVTLMKNFPLGGDKRLQIRAGFFNIFNMAFATGNDIDLGLQTVCNRRVDGVPDGTGGTANGVCDPTGGFSFTPQTLQNFGRIHTKRGHRVIELAAKLYF